ncbi:hypothetical protein ACHQM5_022469 [Ranunculus cassubicifolius]
MEGLLTEFVLACFIVTASLSPCFIIYSQFPKGIMRLMYVLFIVATFVVVPYRYFSSFYLQFYGGAFIGWLASFNLLLFAFGKDDTLSVYPHMSLLQFVLLTTLPIKLKQKPSPESKTKTPWWKTTVALNLLLWFFFAQFYITCKNHVLLTYPFVVHGLFTLRMFFGVQANFVILAALAKPFFHGREFEKQFDDPLLSTSLQVFGEGAYSLRTSIHVPAKSLFTPILGKRWALHAAILATFVVSGLMHELMQFYIGHQWPTWEVFWFFIIQAVALSVEIEVKKIAATKGWKLHAVISRLLTLGFILITGSWLVYAEFIHAGADSREIEEYSAFFAYLKQWILKWTLNDIMLYLIDIIVRLFYTRLYGLPFKL